MAPECECVCVSYTLPNVCFFLLNFRFFGVLICKFWCGANSECVPEVCGPTHSETRWWGLATSILNRTHKLVWIAFFGLRGGWGTDGGRLCRSTGVADTLNRFAFGIICLGGGMWVVSSQCRRVNLSRCSLLIRPWWKCFNLVVIRCVYIEYIVFAIANYLSDISIYNYVQ